MNRYENHNECSPRLESSDTLREFDPIDGGITDSRCDLNMIVMPASPFPISEAEQLAMIESHQKLTDLFWGDE